MDVDVGNTSNDQDIPAERLLNNLQIRFLSFVFVLCLRLIICFPCFRIICRIEAFEAILGQHVLANHVDQMSIDDIEQTVNRESAAPYTRRQVEFILEVWKKKPTLFKACHIIASVLGCIKTSFPSAFRGCKMQTG